MPLLRHSLLSPCCSCAAQFGAEPLPSNAPLRLAVAVPRCPLLFRGRSARSMLCRCGAVQLPAMPLRGASKLRFAPAVRFSARLCRSFALLSRCRAFPFIAGPWPCWAIRFRSGAILCVATPLLQRCSALRCGAVAGLFHAVPGFSPPSQCFATPRLAVATLCFAAAAPSQSLPLRSFANRSSSVAAIPRTEAPRR